MLDFKFEILKTAYPMLCQGVWATAKVVFFSFILAMLFGLIVGVARYRSRSLYLLFSPYVEFFRGTPLLIQLFFIYYGLPTIGISMDSFTAACLGLGLNGGAYISEIIRGSLLSVDQDQLEASYALGLTWFQSMVYVIFPQAFTVAIPPLVNSFSSLLKDTSLVSVLAITELTRVGQLIYTRTFRAFEIYLAIGMLYFMMTFVMTLLSKYLEKKYKVQGRIS
ncbi:amino acid ABC transporter permease [Desulfotalea psychrophila]|uniref:Putative glutamine transport system permease protein GlnP n=1 Tax=Desulfotalea psychrophila (strain LSv54 / DSM 12343) TaxID=177439 RepID=Q6AMY5_DESPS|nr:amino acid ABC transporter permease [Desulfotalea psychrophila]CAG36289.1 probable amino acid ABC transporter, permease protein [Desulfotalea psychrophila LSv54]